MTPFRQPKITKSEETSSSGKNFILVALPLITGFVTVLLGRDINWDLKNYHYYNAYAFVTHRLDFDVAPAQLQTFINPLGYVPFYWLTEHFPSWAAGFILGAIHGVNLSFILSIFWKLSTNTNHRSPLRTSILLALISGIAPGFVSELGNTMNDNLISLFVLGGLLLLISALAIGNQGRETGAPSMILLAGLSMGIGVGLKQTIGIFALASAIALFIQPASWSERFKRIFIYGFAGLAGGLISGGYWAWAMWSRFRNPFFPFYNDIFKSPYFSSMSFNWDLFLPDQLWQHFFWPLLFSLNGSLVNPLHFSDIRFGLLYLVCLAWLVISVMARILPKKQKPAMSARYNFDQSTSNYLLAFFGFAFIFWMLQFSNYRYMVSLELLVPLCFLIVLERIVSSHQYRNYLAIGALLLTLAYFRPFNWGRVAWDDQYFTVDASRFDASEEAVVILLGRAPISYVIPQLPANYRFVRPEGNIQTYADANGIIQPRPDNHQMFFFAVKDILNKHTGPLYVLYDKNEPGLQPAASLLHLGITASLEDCSLLKINTPDMLEVCLVLKR